MLTLPSFLDANVGKWLAQRSSFYLEASREQSGKLELLIRALNPEDAVLQNLALAPPLIGGLCMEWQGTLVAQNRPYIGKSMLVLHADQHVQVVQNNQSCLGTYCFRDQALSLKLIKGDLTSEERIWFASDNLRLRALTVSRQGGLSTTSFFSEIRVLPPQENGAT